MISALTQFSGSIGRKTWWIGMLLVTVIGLALSLVALSAAGYSFDDLSKPSNLRSERFMERYIAFSGWLQLGLLALLAYPSAALMAQRLNDRDRPLWLIAVFLLPSLVSAGVLLSGQAYVLGGREVPEPTSLLTAATWLNYVVGLWAIVELGFLAGRYRG